MVNDEKAASATGLSRGCAYNDVRLAEMFPAEELNILVQRGITHQQMLEISYITEREKQQGLMALIASGLEFSNAWMHIFSS